LCFLDKSKETFTPFVVARHPSSREALVHFVVDQHVFGDAQFTYFDIYFFAMLEKSECIFTVLYTSKYVNKFDFSILK